MKEGNQKNIKRNSRVLSAMFDVRPVNERGELDKEKINQIAAILDLRKLDVKKIEIGIGFGKERPRIEKIPETIEEIFPEEDIESISEPLPTREEILAELILIDEEEENLKLIPDLAESLAEPEFKKEEIAVRPDAADENYFQVSKGNNWSSSNKIGAAPIRARRFFRRKEKRNNIFGLAVFLLAGFLISFSVPVLGWFSSGLEIKEKITASSLDAFKNLLSAQISLKETDFSGAEKNFSLAYRDFLEANSEIRNLGRLTLGILEQLPGGSLVESGVRLVKVGENLALAGENLSAAINSFSYFDFNGFNSGAPLTDSIALSLEKSGQALEAVSSALEELNQVEIRGLPEELQEKTLALKEKLPSLEKILGQSLDYFIALLEILGQDNQRQYLLLFQNNGEMRATGGFIGTYGLLTLDQGQIKKLFIDGIFNPDGQLQEKIIPPRPIQKISTGWSMHDANWFIDFPTSAKKVAWFYEKSGGPTVDGGIAITPTVIERLLELTGPIEMPEYGLALTAENFVELVQNEVESDYDKKLNQPKKILADFAPKFIEKLTQSVLQGEILKAVLAGFKEKHILLYFIDEELEKFAQAQGWAGQILETDKDYLSVVSSNINGYKTDRVVEEDIEHETNIQADGSIIDTVAITREHQGGNLEYDWWNRVNSNYLRVYLPRGSELLDASGQTLETYIPPLDYEKHGFKPDPLVKSIEESMIIDSKTGTQIFEENNRTVFGNWVYVSPGETVKITYQYKLPFKIDLIKSSDSYSLLVQKQAGSPGSQFNHILKFPDSWQKIWQYPENGEGESDLKIDRFFGAMFEF